MSTAAGGAISGGRNQRIRYRFGYLEAPFTGEIIYHSGTDIVISKGIVILATAEGSVTIANSYSIAPWDAQLRLQKSTTATG